MKKIKLLLIFVLACFFAQAKSNSNSKRPRNFYLIQIYHCSNLQQVDQIDAYLKSIYLPFLHANGISKVGVFAPIDNDTATDKRLFVWIPLKSINELDELDQKKEALDPFSNDPLLQLDGIVGSLPYNRVESILTKAFKFQPQFSTKSNLTKSNERVYEYRSYESPSEKSHLNKVHMFNEGREIELFEQLNFNAIFYSKALVGSRTPNLIYMTSFNNMEDRNEHWKAFSAHPLWKNISTAPMYLKNVNRNETILMHARDYADF